MRQRNLCGIVLLLAAVLAGTVLAQNTGNTTGEEKKPAPWATSGHEPAATGAPPVIATSQPMPPGLPPEARLPVPDDALAPLVRGKGKGDKEARKQGDKETAPAGSASPASLGAIQQTGYVQPATTGPTAAARPEGAQQAGPGQRPGGEMQRPSDTPQRSGSAPTALQLQHAGTSALALTVEGPAEAAPGQMASFTVVARNVGTAVLAGVQIELPLPETVHALDSEPPAQQKGNRLTWNLGNVEGGVERRLKVDLNIGEAGEMHLCPTASFSDAVGLRTRVIHPAFELTLRGSESTTRGNQITWHIGVANHGSAPLQHVTLTCRLSDGLVHPQGDSIQTDLPNGLAPGQVYTLDLAVQAAKAGRQVLSLEAKADGGRTALAQGVVKVNELVLALGLDGTRQARVGEELDFRMQVSNPGNDPSGPVQLRQILPVGLEFVSAGSGGTFNPATQTITWTMNSLEGLRRQDVAFRVRASKGGDWALAGSVQAGGLAEVRAAYAVHVESPPSLTVDVNVPDEPVAQNGTTTYEVRIRNGGPAPASGVRLRMILPDCVGAIEATAPTRWQIQGQQVHFEPFEQMSPRIALVYRVRVRGVSQGAGRFRVEVTADGLSKPMEQERTCRVQTALTLR